MKAVSHVSQAILTLNLIACGGGEGSVNTSQPEKIDPSRLVWSKALPTASFVYYSSPALSADEESIYIGTSKNVRNSPCGSDLIVAFNRSGGEKWRYVLPNSEEVRSSPVVHNGNIYFTAEKRTSEFQKAYRDLVALDAVNQIWRKRVSDYPAQTGSGLSKVVAYENQEIYTGLDIYAFNDQTGEILYQRLCNCGGRQDRFVNGAVNYNGELVFYNEGKLLKLDLNNYQLAGEFLDIGTFEGDLVFSTPAIDSNNNSYFASETKLFYAYTPNGDLAWQYDLKADVTWSSPAIDSQGIAYIGTLSEAGLSSSNATGKIMAINTDNSGIVANTWAKIYRDNQNSGVAK